MGSFKFLIEVPQRIKTTANYFSSVNTHRTVISFMCFCSSECVKETVSLLSCTLEQNVRWNEI